MGGSRLSCSKRGREGCSELHIFMLLVHLFPFLVFCVLWSCSFLQAQCMHACAHVHTYYALCISHDTSCVLCWFFIVLFKHAISYHDIRWPLMFVEHVFLFIASHDRAFGRCSTTRAAGHSSATAATGTASTTSNDLGLCGFPPLWLVDPLVWFVNEEHHKWADPFWPRRRCPLQRVRHGDQRHHSQSPRD